MDIKTDNITEYGLNDRPIFYENMSGLPSIKRTDSSGAVNSSVFPIIKHINQKLLFKVNTTTLDHWDNATIGHGIGTIYYVFCRWRIEGASSWTMCPQTNRAIATDAIIPPKFYFNKIQTGSVEVQYYDFDLADNFSTVPLKDTTIEVDLYFVDIPFQQ